ncbi:hypothetical protein EDB83DRAFT_2413231 [Lactarius deliciosus]|nr:hypothetical protein EDB83DRAFT_2413231 [Lactarius deliciosus]
MRVILPALTVFHYRGCCEYLEDFLAQIDAPRLDDLAIEYFVQEIQATQLSRFIDHAKNLRLDKFRRAELRRNTMVSSWSTCPYVLQREPSGRPRGPCTPAGNGRHGLVALLRVFPAVKTLHLSGGVAAPIASALEGNADPEEMVTDVLPALRLIWLDEDADDEDEDEDHNEPHQLSGCPVTVVDTKDEFDRRR